MKKITIIELDREFDIPESWEEMTDEQVLFIFREYYYACKFDNSDAFISRVLDCLILGKTKISSDEFRWSPHSKELATVLFDFLFRVTVKGYELNFNEKKNYLPKLKIRLTSFVGPKDNISNLTFEEFEKANMYLNEYISGDAESLYLFAACLYRPKKQSFDEDLLEKNAKLIKENCREIWKLEMILLWYCNCVQEIKTEDIYFNGSIVNFSVLFNSGSSGGDAPPAKNDLGWLAVLFDFAEKGIFGNLKQTREANLYDLLALMLDKYKENERLKKEYEKIHRKH